MIVFASKSKRSAMPYLKNLGLMCRLWLSQSRMAMIFPYDISGKNVVFSDRTELFDSGSVVEDSGNSGKNSEKNSTKKSTLDIWAEQTDIQKTLKLLHRLLQHVKQMAEAMQSQGVYTFALKQLRKRDMVLSVETKESPSAHLVVDLISPKVQHDFSQVRDDDETEGVDAEVDYETKDRGETVENQK
ncbi:uncharacterized protein F4817DRAFT_367522 [Daldinia loculata]|uniref:uncharacterized protein n=1 Tax=Daldinia loculata TaxID=103429 RepID=UPI0020C3BB61|nr:uncharacterized protein F4817DRAFT_367522 [Daldinia loculata]KAI1650974.1 hypothetical protein F4817DRAFT_367522 [Daldinia loculata]